MATEKVVLITGGAGYIGSHTTVEVLNAGYSAVVIDNLCNSSIGKFVIETKTHSCIHVKN